MSIVSRLLDVLRQVLARRRTLPAVQGIERTSPAFRRELVAVADRLGLEADWLAAIIAFETAGSFSPAQPNLAGSGAVGLIQFLPGTAKSLGTSTGALAVMTDVEQLVYVERYFAAMMRWRGRPSTLAGTYALVLAGRLPGADGVLFRRGDGAYERNAALDRDRDGDIEAAEAAAPVAAILERAAGRPRVVV